MDFITDLPPCGGFNGIYTCVDKLPKFVKHIPVSIEEGALSTPEVACLFFEQVVRLFGIPRVVLQDRAAHFTTHFWRYLWELLGSRAALSLAYHPQMDGRPNILIGQWNRLSAVFWLSMGSLRNDGTNSLAQLNWLSIQMIRIL